MSRICFARGCFNARGKKGSEKVSFFKLPANEERREKWILCVDKNKESKSKNIQICSDHFEELDFAYCFEVKTYWINFLPMKFLYSNKYSFKKLRSWYIEMYIVKYIRTCYIIFRRKGEGCVHKWTVYCILVYWEIIRKLFLYSILNADH